MRNKSSSNLSSRTATSSHSHAHTVHRPKRNKSSSSLHSAGHGHHSVQFPHHGRKNSTSSGGSGTSKRSGSHSGGRKPAFGFGMTTLSGAGGGDQHHGSDEEEDRHEDEEEDRSRRPGFDRRGSSASTVVETRGRQRSTDGRGSRSRSRPKSSSRPRATSSPERPSPEHVEVHIQDVTPMATPPREQRQQNPHNLKKGGAMDKVVGSYQSTTGTTSDWESATDSPAPAKRELPEAPKIYRQDTISGLGQVLGEGDRVASEEDARVGTTTPPVHGGPAKSNGSGLKEEEKSRPTTPRRAKFEIDDTEDSPPSPEVLQQLQQNDQHPVDATVPAPAVAPGPTPAQTPFSSEPQSPVKEHALKPVTPPEQRRSSAPPAAAPTQQQQSTVPFPSTSNLTSSPTRASTTALVASPSPSRPPPHSRPPAARKSSNASLMSNASARSMALSFAGRMGPPAPHMFRRTASSAAPPTVDRSSVARAELSHVEGDAAERDIREHGLGGAEAKSGRGHRRTESLGSVRSLRTVAEGAGGHGPAGAGHTSPSRHPARAATVGVSEGRDGVRRARQSTGSESSGALTALGNIQGGVERGGPPRRSASGYFSALRGLTTGLTGLTPPLSPSASTGALAGAGGASGRHPIPGASAHGFGGGPSNRGKQRASPSPAQFAPAPVISKFIEPQDLIAPPSSAQDQQVAASPSSSRFGPQARNGSSASLAGTGAMSRTQQKAFLARDAPYWSGSNTPNAPGGSSSAGAGAAASGSGFYAPGQPTGAGAPLPLPPPPAQQLLQLQAPSSGKMTRTASGGTNTYPTTTTSSSSSSSTPSPASGAPDQARQQGMQKWAYGLVREAERIERQYRAVGKWRDPLGESLERVLAQRREKARIGGAAGGAKGGAALVAAKGECGRRALRRVGASLLTLLFSLGRSAVSPV